MQIALYLSIYDLAVDRFIMYGNTYYLLLLLKSFKNCVVKQRPHQTRGKQTVGRVQIWPSHIVSVIGGY